MPTPLPYRVIRVAVAGLFALVLLALALGFSASDGRSHYDLVKDLILPLFSPLVAVLIPVLLLFVIPYGQSRHRLALELCELYYTEEMRQARNVGWAHFVAEQQQLPPVRRAERLNNFLDYHSNLEAHRGIDAGTDATYQKTARVLDFFAMVNGCVGRGVADPDVVRDFLLFYYLWWRDEIMDPMRKTRRIVGDHPKSCPIWWQPLTHLDALAGPLPRKRGAVTP